MKSVPFVGTALVLIALGTSCSKTNPMPVLRGGGSTLAYPVLSVWAHRYEKTKGAAVNYESIGSPGGIQAWTEGKSDFCCSDWALDDGQIEQTRSSVGDVIQLPLFVTAAVIVHNLPGINAPLNFSGLVLADIFLGKIRRWNDAALRGLNPGVALPDLEISAVYRADESATTFAFTQYLSLVSAEWKQRVGFGTSVDWPVGLGTKQSQYNTCMETSGSITYVELAFAVQKNAAHGTVRNQAGHFRHASPESLTAAAESTQATSPQEVVRSVTNAPGEESYPICGYTWIVAHRVQPANKRGTLVEFLHWVTHDGQQDLPGMSLGRLPPSVVAMIDKQLLEIQKAP